MTMLDAPTLPPDTMPAAGEAMPPMLAPVQPKWHDVTIVSKRKTQKARVEPVPPEEFGISRNARSLRDCGYCFHEVRRRQGDLIDDGYDAKQIKSLPSFPLSMNSEEQARDTVAESQGAAGDDNLNDANRLLLITEHYCRLDMERNGKVALWRITTGGQEGEILRRDGKDDVELVDMLPFAAMTPVIITHRFFGRSIADLVMDIQRIKTALLRGALDNLYLHNNPRVEVSESHATEQTLDDLLVSRPGGVVRTKQPGGLNWQVVPDITGSVYPALQYFDTVREWRTGVSAQGQGLDANALQNQSATAANQLFTAAQARMKLIARIFAETGIRDLFQLVHATIRKHGSEPQTVRLRNSWVQVDPRDWKSRNDMTVKVGLGTGGKTERLAGLQLLIGAQEKAVAVGLVSKKNFYNSAKELTKLLDHKNPDDFFTPPGAPQGQNGQPPDPDAAPIQPPADPKMQELQAKNEIEKTQAQADIATQQTKTQAEIAQNDRKMAMEAEMAQKQFEFDARLKLLEHELKKEAQASELQHKGQLAQQDAHFNQHRLHMETNAKIAQGSGQQVDREGNVSLPPELSSGLSKLAEAIVASQETLAKAITAPRKSTVHRDPKTNRVTHATSE